MHSVIKSYELMLDFYGFGLDRYHFLPHNNLVYISVFIGLLFFLQFSATWKISRLADYKHQYVAQSKRFFQSHNLGESTCADRIYPLCLFDQL